MSGDAPRGTGHREPLSLLAAFGRFWWDFLVGDTPGLTVGALVALGVALGAEHTHLRLLGFIGMPVVVLVTLAASLARVARRRTRPDGSG